MRKLLLAVIGCIVPTYAALIFVDSPTVVVCERGRTPSVEVSSTHLHGYFDERHIGPCVLYFHHGRQPGLDYGPLYPPPARD
jgi:hypothetical protein